MLPYAYGCRRCWRWFRHPRWMVVNVVVVVVDDAVLLVPPQGGSLLLLLLHAGEVRFGYQRGDTRRFWDGFDDGFSGVEVCLASFCRGALCLRFNRASTRTDACARSSSCVCPCANDHITLARSPRWCVVAKGTSLPFSERNLGRSHSERGRERIRTDRLRLCVGILVVYIFTKIGNSSQFHPLEAVMPKLAEFRWPFRNDNQSRPFALARFPRAVA